MDMEEVEKRELFNIIDTVRLCNDYILIKEVDFFMEYKSELYSFGQIINKSGYYLQNDVVLYKKYKEQEPLTDNIWQMNDLQFIHQSHTKIPENRIVNYIFIKESQVICRFNDFEILKKFSIEREREEHCCDKSPRSFGELRPGETYVKFLSHAVNRLSDEERARRNAKAAATKAANKAKKIASSNW